MFFSLSVLNLEDHLGLVISPQSPLSAGYITLQACRRSLPLRFSTVTPGGIVRLLVMSYRFNIPDRLVVHLSVHARPEFGHTVGYVRYPTLIRSIRIELSLEPVGRHDTGLAFTCPRAPVSDLSLYPDTFHQSPDSVHSALLSAVPQIQMDFAITIDASRFQPELFNLSCQSQVCLMAL